MMLFLISPAKTLDLTSPVANWQTTQPQFLKDSEKLIRTARKLSPEQLAKLMSISADLAQLNYDRFQAWHLPFSPQNARPAALTFKGDVYVGLEADNFTKIEWDYAQKHLRILSGLYGLLRPLDLIQAYRLEMGTDLENEKGANLYDFWADKLTEALNRELTKHSVKYVINLASQEYFKAINPKKLEAEIITPQFKEWKDGKFQMVSFFAKKARGMMCRFAIQHRLKDPEDLQAFDTENYQFRADLSTKNTWLFGRG